jgi:hypothetical protein
LFVPPKTVRLTEKVDCAYTARIFGIRLVTYFVCAIKQLKFVTGYNAHNEFGNILTEAAASFVTPSPPTPQSARNNSTPTEK